VKQCVIYTIMMCCKQWCFSEISLFVYCWDWSFSIDSTLWLVFHADSSTFM